MLSFVVIKHSMASYYLNILCVVALATYAASLDNGLARTPPMGWLSWQRFRCNVDCKAEPDACINEKLYMQMADRMAADGYKDAGYEYVNIDDCWAMKERDPKTLELVPDKDRFPSGMKALADYVHNKGLKLGIYGDMGTKTCGGYPGSKFTMETDARTFAKWGIDSFKMDGCYSTTDDFTIAYPIMELFLNLTGRPILFSCSWPAYEQAGHPDYPKIAKYCNIWRNYNDIDDSWDSVKSIIKYYGDNKGNFSEVAGPGNFNDPDMIVVGNTGLSHTEEQAQMAMWAMMAAPLLLSSDLRTISPDSKALILNKGVIALNQDKLGIMGRRIWQVSSVEAWLRPLTPQGSYAVAILNTGQGGYKRPVSFSLKSLSVKETGTYNVTEVFSGKTIGTFTSDKEISVQVDESSVFLCKFTKISGKKW